MLHFRYMSESCKDRKELRCIDRCLIWYSDAEAEINRENTIASSFFRFRPIRVYMVAILVIDVLMVYNISFDYMWRKVFFGSW